MHIASAATSVKFHDLPDGHVIYNYQPGSKVDGDIRSISWSKDGNWLALVPHSGLTEIVSIRDQLKLMHTIQDVEEPSCASFQNTTKKHIALGTKSGQVLIYDIKARSVKKRFPRTTSLITYVEFLAKDAHLVASSASGDIFVYNNVSNNMTCSFRIPKSETVSALRSNTTKRNLITGGSKEGIVMVWDIHVNKSKFFTEAHKAPVTAVTFSPVNSDLILSAGLDRQFCFYDIISRTAISNIPVENNITCADFSSDGLSFILASQNGKIYVYDSRRIQEPTNIFEGHRSAVKHLLYQKSEDSDIHDSSHPSEHFELIKQEIQPVEIQTRPENNSDSFGLFIEGSGAAGISEDVTKSSVKSPEAGDSFIAAMGLNNTNTGSCKADRSMRLTEGIKKWMSSKTQCMNETPIIPAESPSGAKPVKFYQEKLLMYDSRSKQTSTPNYLSQEVISTISPIISSNHITNHSVKLMEKPPDVSQAIKNEVKESLDEVSKYLDFQFKSGMSNIRQTCLDLHMAMIKEFIKLENNLEQKFNGLREDLSGEMPLSDRQLLEENVRLRKRVTELEAQLVLKSDQVNGID